MKQFNDKEKEDVETKELYPGQLLILGASTIQSPMHVAISIKSIGSK